MPLRPESKPIKFRLSVKDNSKTKEYSNVEDLKKDFPIEHLSKDFSVLSRLFSQNGDMERARKMEDIKCDVLKGNTEDIIHIVFKEEVSAAQNTPLSLGLEIHKKFPLSGLSIVGFYINQRPNLIQDFLDYNSRTREFDDEELSLLYSVTKNEKLSKYKTCHAKGPQDTTTDEWDPFGDRDEMEETKQNNNIPTQYNDSVLSHQFDRPVKSLRKLIDINTPIICICDHDFVRVDRIIKESISDLDSVIEWNPGTYATNFDNKESLLSSSANVEGNNYTGGVPLITFLEDKLRLTVEQYLVLKDIHLILDERQKSENYNQVVSLLHTIAQKRLYDGPNKHGKFGYKTTVIIVTSVPISMPKELLPYVSYLDIPRPNEEEISAIIDSHLITNKAPLEGDKNKIVLSLKGLSSFEIDRALDMAMGENGNLSDSDTDLITEQKKQMIKNSGLLELIEAKGNIDDIGGLKYLKEYLSRKGTLFCNYKEAYDFGVSLPKGIMLVGMPGCGKSMCAKAASMLFSNIPLLKMDIGNLQGQYVGQSEANMREAIKMAEAAAPCILWIDEIEKAFSGIGNSQEAYTTRMFGSFLSWMQDKTSQVYIIATANNVENLPPEFKRKGRFDEIFCTDLPHPEERKSIFDAQLSAKPRKCHKLSQYKGLDSDIKKLLDKTDGCNGADIVSIIESTLEKIFIENKDDIVNKRVTPESLKSNDSLILKKLIAVAEKTTCILKSCSKQIGDMRTVFKSNSFKDANTGEIKTEETKKN